MVSFREACKNNNIWLAKDIYNSDRVKEERLDYIYNTPYLFATNNNDSNCKKYDNLHFRWACENNNLEMAKWLFYDLDRVNLPDKAFVNVCYLGRLEMAKWLWSTGRMDYKDGFLSACSNNSFEIIYWLWSLPDETDRRDRNKNILRVMFKQRCSFRNIKWLFFLDNDLHNDIPEELLNGICQVNVFESTQSNLIEMYINLEIS